MTSTHPLAPLVTAVTPPPWRRVLEELAYTEGAYADNTVRARRADLALFFNWALSQSALPASMEAILATFITQLGENNHRPASVLRAVSSLSFAFRHAPSLKALGVGDPTQSETVKLTLRTLKRQGPMRQRQAAPLNWVHIQAAFAQLGDSLRDVRDKALVMTAYDTLCRRAELAAFQLEDLVTHYDDEDQLTHGTLLLRDSKTDHGRHGEEKYLSPFTLERINAWLRAAGISSGALFRGVYNSGHVGERISPEGVQRTLKRIAKQAGLDPETISGHSCRVGATQDMTAENLDLALIMRAGGWKTPRMPAKYAEKLLTRRGGMAKLAAKQRRDKGP